MKKQIYLIILLLTCRICDAQYANAQNTFNKKLKKGLVCRGLSVVEIPTGFVVVGGQINDTAVYANNLLVKFDLNGDTVKTLFISPPDSTYWYLYNQDPDDIFTDISLTNDGNIIAVGRTQAYNPSNMYDYDVMIVKLNYNLDTLWMKIISHPFDSTLEPQSIIKTSDNGFLVCGYSHYFLNNIQIGFLLKTDSAGNFQWLKSYSNPGPEQNIWGITETASHEYICSGSQYINWLNDEVDPMIFKVDSSGNQQWVYTQLSAGADYGTNTINSNDGNFITESDYKAGNSSLDHWKPHLVKYDSSNTIIWDKIYEMEYTFGGTLCLSKAVSNGYVFGGGTNNVVQTLNGVNGYIFRVDENGDSLWSRQFDLFAFDVFWDIKTTTDGGYIMCGGTYCCNNDTENLWLVKTDSLGFLPVGIQEQENAKGTKLSAAFPNPCKESFSVTAIVPQTTQQGYGKKGAYLFLFEATGRQLKEIPLSLGVNNLKVDMSGYSQGTYLCVMVINGYNVNKLKIVKE